MKEEDRDIITLTKAVGIILVVLAHAIPTEHIVFLAIYTFHMPLFFIMSGYCFKDKYLSDAKQFVIRKWKGIWLPYILFALPILALHNVFCDLNIYNPEDIYGWKRMLWESSRIVTRMSNCEQLLGTFWFLKELFWGNLIFYGMIRLWKGKVLPTAITLLALSEVAILTDFRVPYFTITFVSFLSAFFIAVGYLWRQKDWRLDRWWLWLIGIGTIAATVIIYFPFFMRNVIPASLPFSIFPAIAGTMMVFEICRWVQPYFKGWVRKISLYIGNQSLFIMALHFLAFKVVLLGMIWYYGLPITKLSAFPIMYDHVTIWSVLLCTIAGVFLPLGVAKIWNIAKIKCDELTSKSIKKC